MSHFYAGIQGQAGDATRMGSKNSGISGYVQSWGARLAVDMGHYDGEDRAYFRLGAGPSNYSGGALVMSFDDATTIVNALGCGDPKIEAIRKRIENEVRKLNAEAGPALKRAERRAIRAQRAMTKEWSADAA